jgi:hypothetical protein
VPRRILDPATRHPRRRDGRRGRREGVNQTEFIRQAILLRLAVADVHRAAAGVDIPDRLGAILDALRRR